MPPVDEDLRLPSNSSDQDPAPSCKSNKHANLKTALQNTHETNSINYREASHLIKRIKQQEAKSSIVQRANCAAEKTCVHVDFILPPSTLQDGNRNCAKQHSCVPGSAHGEVPFCKPHTLKKNSGPRNSKYSKNQSVIQEPSERAKKTQDIHPVLSNAVAKNGALYYTKG